MRHHLIAFAVMAAVSLGAAQAAPEFGSASHRLGGDASPPAEREAAALSLFQSLLAMFGIEISASVEPVAGDDQRLGKTKSRECDEAGKAEVASADRKEGSQESADKPRMPTGEPVYLAF